MNQTTRTGRVTETIPATAEYRVHEWAAGHLRDEPGVTSAVVANTGGGVLAVEVRTEDGRTYLVAHARRATGGPNTEAWAADLDPNEDDCDTFGPTALAAFRGERTAAETFAGGPLARDSR